MGFEMRDALELRGRTGTERTSAQCMRLDVRCRVERRVNG